MDLTGVSPDVFTITWLWESQERLWDDPWSDGAEAQRHWVAGNTWLPLYLS